MNEFGHGNAVAAGEAVSAVGASFGLLFGIGLVLFIVLTGLLGAWLMYRKQVLGGLVAWMLCSIAVAFVLVMIGMTHTVQVVQEPGFLTQPPQASAVSGSFAETVSLREEWELLNKPKIELEESAVDVDDEAAAADEAEAEAADAGDERPDWVDTDTKMVGHVVRQVIHSGPYKTTEECRLALEPMIAEAVRKRVRRLATTSPGSATHTVPPVSELGIGLGYIFRDLCVDDFVEDYEASIGDMKKVHVLMEFRPAEDEFLLSAYQKYQRRQSLFTVAGLAALAVSVVAAAYGLLKVDTWSKGYYTQRLLLGGGGAILVLVAIGVMVAL